MTEIKKAASSTDRKDSIDTLKIKYSFKIELYFWIISFIALIVHLVNIFNSNQSISLVLLNNLSFILVSIFITIIVVMTHIVFEELPFSMVIKVFNYALATLVNEDLEAKRSKINENANVFIQIKNILDKLTIDDIKDSPEYILKNSMVHYSKTCDRINSKSNAYLFIGCLIAFAGVTIPIYSDLLKGVSEKTLTPVSNLTEIFIVFFPKISTMIFIEFIAFFFLKQYRIMQEDFKYFDKIKRQQMNELLFVFILDKYEGKMEVINLYKERLSQDINIKLNSGETTEAIENHKAINHDLDILSKLNELVKSARGGNN